MIAPAPRILRPKAFDMHGFPTKSPKHSGISPDRSRHPRDIRPTASGGPRSPPVSLRAQESNRPPPNSTPHARIPARACRDFIIIAQMPPAHRDFQATAPGTPGITPDRPRTTATSPKRSCTQVYPSEPCPASQSRARPSRPTEIPPLRAPALTSPCAECPPGESPRT